MVAAGANIKTAVPLRLIIHLFDCVTMRPTKPTFQIGDSVRSTRPADRGRPQGTIVEHDLESGRYRVQWPGKRTWMKADALVRA